MGRAVRRAARPRCRTSPRPAARARERGHGMPRALAPVAPEGPHLPRPARGRPAEDRATEGEGRRPRARLRRRPRAPPRRRARRRSGRRAATCRSSSRRCCCSAPRPSATGGYERQGPEEAVAPAGVAARPAGQPTPAAAPSASRLRPPRPRPRRRRCRGGGRRARPGLDARARRPRRRPRSSPRRRPRPLPRPTPTPAPTPTPTPAAPAATAVAPAAAPAEPRTEPAEPAVLTALSPLSIRRPGRALLDLRGTGLRADLRARVLPAARGAARHLRGTTEVGERQPGHRPPRARRHRRRRASTPSPSRTRTAARPSR